MKIVTSAPKSKQIADLLEGEIISGKLQPNSRLCSIRTLMDKFSVGKNVVHGAFNILKGKKIIRMEHGRGSFVNKLPKSFFKDRENQPQYGLTPEKTPGNKKVIFADCWHDLNHPYCARLLQGIMIGAERHDLRVEVRILRRGGIFKEQNTSLWEEIVNEDADGLIISWITEELCREIRKVHPQMAIVSTFSRLADSRMASVMEDWKFAGFQAARHLLENGAGKILLVTPDNIDFVAGCKEALAAEQTISTSLRHEIVKMDDDMETFARRLAADLPQGMAFSDDRLACKVLKACEKIIPHFWKKTKVVSVDNFGEDSLLPTHVARILFDSRELGEAVMDSMAALLNGRSGGNSVVLIKSKRI